MEKICLEIDKAILSILPTAGLNAYGLCELVTKDKQQHPVQVSFTDRTRKQAQIHDAFEGIFYHRLLNSNQAEDVDNSFGVDISDKVNARLRTFIAYKVRLGEEFIYEFVNAIPKKTEISGYKFIHRSSSIDLIVDHEGVYNQEYGSTTPYEKHRTTWNIFAIEYNLEFIKC